MTVFNLVRIGLAKASCTSIYRSPKFETAWRLLNEDELQEYHSNLVQRLREVPHGPYTALVNIVGQKMADQLAKTGQVVRRSLTTVHEDEPSPKRRRLQ